MEEEIRAYANSLQRRRDKTPERVTYGKSEPSVTGGSGDEELLGWNQAHMSQEKGTGAVRPERARGPSPGITVCSETEEYDTGSFRHLFGSFNQVTRSAINEINRTTGRTLGRVVPSQRLDHSLNSSERIP